MAKAIIYQGDGGGVSIIHMSPDCEMTIEQVAQKDVPAGKPYKIVDASIIPVDRADRAAWTVDEVDLTDGVGGA